MKITTILFDLDGTLLPMDNEEFTREYFKLLCQRFVPLGYDSRALVDGVWAGTYAMVKNDGSCTNEKAFWNKFAEKMGIGVLKHKPLFDAFYLEEFNEAKKVCGFSENTVCTVKALKSSGYRIALATNPIFPAAATESRIRWAGFEPSDFELYTTYENIGYCKPNTEYYKEILRRLNVSAEECLMVGNDVGEDMVAETVGINVFLLTDNLINKDKKDISVFHRGGFDDLTIYLTK